MKIKILLLSLSLIVKVAFSQNTTPSDSLTENKIYKFLDDCVKECNGGLVSTKNYHQLAASFTNEGYAALTDERLLSDEDVHFYATIGIKWGHIINISSSKLTFQYSCICIEFAEGFSPASFWNRNTNYKVENNIQLMNHLKEFSEWPYDNYYENKYRGGFTIVVRAEKVESCISHIKKLNELAKINLSVNANQKTLKKQEKYENGYLVTSYVDAEGVLQGRYEVRDRDGKLIMYGNYRDNQKVGNWVENGRTINYNEVGKFCGCTGYH